VRTQVVAIRKPTAYVWIVALATFGSGLINLFSVMGPPPSERIQALREVFPLEFLHAARFLTLLIGFALVVSSVNIYRRKKRAFQIVLGLTFFSAVFHITKSLDYLGAAVSLLLTLLLLATRSSFNVKSSTPNLRSAFERLALAFIAALTYGVAGLWLLDKRQFGINFTIGDSIHRTLLLLSLVGDPELVPQTVYARWFLDSLNLMTATAIVFAVYVLFRPAIYQYRTLPRERALATQIAHEYGRSPMDYFKLWPDKEYFFSRSHRTFIAYGMAGNFAVALGDPVGPEAEIEETVRDFVQFCTEHDWRFAFHQTLPDFLSIYKRLRLKKLKIGDDAIVDLNIYSVDGKANRRLRSSNRELEKDGVTFTAYQPPLPDNILVEAQSVSEEWLQIPGRRERTFTLGHWDPEYVRSTELCCARSADGTMLAFVNLLPPITKLEVTGDLMRRRVAAPNGIMDYVFVKVFQLKKEQGVERFSLGMAPMSGFQEREEATPEERAIHSFFQQLNFLFSFKGLRFYKAKYATHWEPRYIVYKNVFELPRAALALRKVSQFKEEEDEELQLAA
jgi:phosphatidylglycerol lysyltransferase